MSQEEALVLAIEFLNECGLYTKFEDYLKSKGYTQEEIDDALD